jgi:hypothetical protein
MGLLIGAFVVVWLLVFIAIIAWIITVTRFMRRYW